MAGSHDLIEASHFPRAVLYPGRCVSHPLRLREPRERFGRFAYTERHLHCVWADPALRPSALVSADGEKIHVEDTGRWNLEAGPDFLGAVLNLGPNRRRVRGDVEIHIHPADWHRHRHATDPRYRRVAAHVTYFPGPVQPVRPGTVSISLQGELESDPSFSFETIDVTQYPYATVIPEGTPCARILAGWSPTERGALLDAAGEARLATKAERMQTAIARVGAGQVLYEEMLCALGYKHNRLPFRDLARRVPLNELQAVCHNKATAYAVLLGVSGLLPRNIHARWSSETRTFIRSLWDRWWRLGTRWEGRTMQGTRWRLAGVRPMNHPVRRMAAAARLFSGRQELSSILLGPENADASHCRSCLEKLLAGDGSPGYWDHHVSLSGKRSDLPLSLVGPQRLSSIIANVVVPFRAAHGQPVDGFLSGLPSEASNSILKQAAHRLFGPDHNPVLYRSGLRRQGLHQIFHDFCLSSRRACRGCALVKALQRHDPE